MYWATSHPAAAGLAPTEDLGDGLGVHRQLPEGRLARAEAVRDSTAPERGSNGEVYT